MLAINKKLFRDFWNLKLQTLSIALIVIGGLSILLASWSSYQSLKKARDDFYVKYSFADIFSEFKRAPSGIIGELKNIPGVENIDGRIMIDSIANLANQDEPAVTRIISMPTSGQPQFNKLYLRMGRLPVEGNVAEVVVHEGFAKAHKLIPGSQFQILIEGHLEIVQVVGIAISPEFVYALSSAAPLPDDIHYGVLWMSYLTLSRLAKLQDSINSVTASISPDTTSGNVLSSFDRILKPYGGLGAYARDRQISNMFVEDEIVQQKAMAIIAPVIFLSVAAFLVNVIFSRLIALNRSQIATLKAIGFTNWEVARHYLTLVILILMVGTLPGLAIGAWLGQIFSKMYLDFFHFPELKFHLSYGALIICVLSGILPGLLGAWQSIRNAFALVPAEAMRPPMPPVYQKNLFDRAVGKKRFRPLSKMIFRNIFHRPDRLVMIILGMATALGIIVTSFSWSDMLYELLDTQFQRIQREDLSVSLLKPVSLNGLQELSKSTGVISIEGYRVTPVRIRFLNHKKELSLTGWPDATQMRQSLSLNLNKITLPENGLMLGRFFQKSWGVKEGDKVEVELIESNSKKIMITVAGFSDELVGLTASMKIQELWKILDEEASYNMATIKADSNKVNFLYTEFKNIPGIEAVILKGSVYKGFQNTMGSLIQLSTSILIFFAMAIAVGVIYNSVRVNFSERSWEMASLRVMGFEKGEVFTLILAEVSLQIFLCLIPGCIIGYWMTKLSLQGIHTETFAFPVVIHTQTYIKAILVVLISLGLCSWQIYRMIDKLSLVEALKSRE